MKRANLSLETIVIAALALIVLVVISFIFVRGISDSSNDLQACPLKGGTCQTSCPNGYAVTAKCPEDRSTCCVTRQFGS